MVNSINSTPSYYSNNSRDYQLLCHLFDSAFFTSQYYINTMLNIYTAQMQDNVVDLQAKTLNFHAYASNNFEVDAYKVICMIFKQLIKKKGTIKAVKQLVYSISLIENINSNSSIDVVMNQDTKILEIYTGVTYSSKNIALLEAVLDYILPVGVLYIIYNNELWTFNLKSNFIMNNYTSVVQGPGSEFSLISYDYTQPTNGVNTISSPYSEREYLDPETNKPYFLDSYDHESHVVAGPQEGSTFEVINFACLEPFYIWFETDENVSNNWAILWTTDGTKPNITTSKIYYLDGSSDKILIEKSCTVAWCVIDLSMYRLGEVQTQYCSVLHSAQPDVEQKGDENSDGTRKPYIVPEGEEETFTINITTDEDFKAGDYLYYSLMGSHTVAVKRIDDVLVDSDNVDILYYKYDGTVYTYFLKEDLSNSDTKLYWLDGAAFKETTVGETEWPQTTTPVYSAIIRENDLYYTLCASLDSDTSTYVYDSFIQLPWGVFEPDNIVENASPKGDFVENEDNLVKVREFSSEENLNQISIPMLNNCTLLTRHMPQLAVISDETTAQCYINRWINLSYQNIPYIIKENIFESTSESRTDVLDAEPVNGNTYYQINTTTWGTATEITELPEIFFAKIKNSSDVEERIYYNYGVNYLARCDYYKDIHDKYGFFTNYEDIENQANYIDSTGTESTLQEGDFAIIPYNWDYLNANSLALYTNSAWKYLWNKIDCYILDINIYLFDE